MNILHMKYAVEVAKAGSLKGASETLLIAQPNLSRSIKELEADLGITIFERNPRGMVLTGEGEEFMGYAREILAQIDQVDRLYREGVVKKQRFSVSVPRACYISEAFARFTTTLTPDQAAEIFYMETGTQRVIGNILENGYGLGIVRYPEYLDKYYKNLLDEKDLSYELLTEFSYQVILNRDHPLAAKESLTMAELIPYMEITHADPHVPSLAKGSREESENEEGERCPRRIFIFERASQFDLLRHNPQTFMWVSLVPSAVLEQHGLVLRPCTDNRKGYRDVLIYRNGYALTKLDKAFITEVCEAKRRYSHEK